jgi:hypothetical protein
MRTLIWLVILLLGAAAPAHATLSIVAFDPPTGDLGVAVASRYFAVGAVVPWAEAGVGVSATQAGVNVDCGSLQDCRRGGEVLGRRLGRDMNRGGEVAGLSPGQGRSCGKPEESGRKRAGTPVATMGGIARLESL